MFIDARIKIQTETNYTIAGLSREIMFKQAELQLTNIIKARESATQLEGQLIQYANQEIGLARGGANGFRPDAGQGQEASEPFRLAGDEAQRQDRQRRGSVLALLQAGLSRP